MNEDEAYLMTRMQLALVYEGVLHSPPAGADGTWLQKDDEIIRKAVWTAWPLLSIQECRTLRHWAPNN